MKKRRGLRRYYKKLRQCNEWQSWCEYLSNSSEWCNFSHQHFDWKGYGDIRWKERKAHLSVLFTHFSIIADYMTNQTRPYQMFAVINLKDSGQDALFFHTPNPYSDFPYKVNRYTSGITPGSNPLIGYLIDLENQGYTILTTGHESFIVYKKGIGESLTAENDSKQYERWNAAEQTVREISMKSGQIIKSLYLYRYRKRDFQGIIPNLQMEAASWLRTDGDRISGMRSRGKQSMMVSEECDFFVASYCVIVEKTVTLRRIFLTGLR